MSAQSPSENRLGAILIRQAGLSLKDLQRGLDIQSERGGLLGEILVELGVLTREDVDQALETQRARAEKAR